MATNDWTDDDDFDLEDDVQQSNDGSDLLKKLRKAKRADEKRIKELTEQLEGLTKVQRERVVKEVLSQKGVNEKAARLILKDLDEVNEQSVSNWLEDNGDLFGLQQATNNTPEKQMDLAALRQQDIVTQGAVTPSKAEDVMMRINAAESAQDIIDMIHNGDI